MQRSGDGSERFVARDLGKGRAADDADVLSRGQAGQVDVDERAVARDDDAAADGFKTERAEPERRSSELLFRM